ncbi:MAG TPA: hypothetical protein VLH13_01845 [Methanomassiliicoccales archaeon]|nr:hypothetical protein [Methanomassiliicoccales archaeon]
MTLVGILYILIGILQLLAGIALLAVGSLSDIDFIDQYGDIDSTIIMLLGGVLILIAIINLLIGVGCFKGWGWVWTLGVVFALINIFFAALQVFLDGGITSNEIINAGISMLIPVLILLYLMTQNVKRFFGKA